MKMGYRKISYFRQLWYVVKYAIHRRKGAKKDG